MKLLLLLALALCSALGKLITDPVVSCKKSTISGRIYEPIHEVSCSVTPTYPLHTLFLPKGLVFNNGVISGTPSVLANNITVFVYCELSYTTVTINIQGSDEEYESHFDITTLNVYPNVYSDFYKLQETFSMPIREVVNPSPDTLHFDPHTKSLSYFGNFTTELPNLSVITELNNRTIQRDIAFAIREPVFDQGVRTCVLKPIPFIQAVDRALFQEDEIEFCYHHTAFSFTHEDPRIVHSSSPRYVSVSALFHLPEAGIYTITLISDSPVILYLDHHHQPLFDDDGRGSHKHSVTLKLDTSYHLLSAYAAVTEKNSFAVYYHSAKLDMVQRLLADTEVFIPPSLFSVSLPSLPLTLWKGVVQSVSVHSLVPQELSFRNVFNTTQNMIVSPTGVIRFHPTESEVSLQLAVASSAGEYRIPSIILPVMEPCEGIEVSLVSRISDTILLQTVVSSFADLPLSYAFIASFTFREWETYLEPSRVEYFFFLEVPKNQPFTVSTRNTCSVIIDNKVVFDPSIALQEIIIAPPSSVLPILIQCSSHDEPSFVMSLNSSHLTTRHSHFHYQSPVIQAISNEFFSVYPVNLPMVPEMTIYCLPPLPIGLSLEEDGTISGIPIEPIHETYTVMVRDGVNHTIASTTIILTITDASVYLTSLRFFNNQQELVNPVVRVHMMESIDITVTPDVSTDYNITWSSDLPTGIQADSYHLWGQIVTSWNADVHVVVCSRMNCLQASISVMTSMYTSFWIARKGLGEISLLQNGTIVLQNQFHEHQVIVLDEMTDNADTLLLTCTASRECLCELWKNGTHKQSFVSQSQNTLSVSLLQSPSLISPTEVMGFEGDTLPTIFWTIPHSIRSISLTSSFIGYQLNEQENCLQGTIIPFKPSSQSVEITVECDQETLRFQPIVTISANHEDKNLLPVEFRITIPHSNSSLPFFSFVNGTLHIDYSKYPSVSTPTVSQYLEIPAGSYTLFLEPEDECLIEILIHGVVIAVRDGTQSEFQFSLSSLIPFGALDWRATIATSNLLNIFMNPEFTETDWDDYQAGETYSITDQVWLLRKEFYVSSVPQSLGLYYQLQGGMMVYLNGHLVFTLDMNEDLSMQSVSNSQSTTLKIGRAVLTSSWLMENHQNVIAIAVSSSSSLQISLFSIATPLSIITRDIQVSSSSSSSSFDRLLFLSEPYSAYSYAHRFSLSLPYPQHISYLRLYYNDTLFLTPAEILVSSMDSEGHIDRLSSDRRHNLFGYNSLPYYRVLKSTRPVDHILIDVLSYDYYKESSDVFMITGLTIVTERAFYCIDETGQHKPIGTWKYYSCPEGEQGFIRSQCVYEEKPFWRTNTTHCITESHDRFETVIQWTYQINMIRAGMGESIIESSTERLSELISFALHNNLNEFSVFDVKEKCSMIHLDTYDIDYYSNINCIQYTIHARVPSSYRTDMWSIIAQADEFCEALKRQYPNERFVCDAIELKGSVSFSPVPSSTTFIMVIGGVMLLLVILSLIVYRNKIRAYTKRRKETRNALRQVNSRIAESLAMPFISPMYSTPGSLVYSTPQGNLFCDQVVRLEGSVVLCVC